MTEGSVFFGARRKSRFGRGFTLVELLVVIAIIGILLLLLMPSVQSAREAGRRIQCKNHINQLATGARTHLTTHGHFPSGGWSWRWSGDPDLGYGVGQPGGWHYNILPYIEQPNLHDLGMNQSESEKREQGKIRAETPVRIFHCPSRRVAETYPYDGRSYFNINTPSVVGRSDYAANSGDRNTATYWNTSSAVNFTEEQWNGLPGTSDDATGVIYRRSALREGAIHDGTSSTYLIGEKYEDPDHYATGRGCASDQGWDLGYDYDVVRWTVRLPMQDTPGVNGCNTHFGSAHSLGFHMSLCDGSVHTISYEINKETHRQLGNRQDGAEIDVTKL